MSVSTCLALRRLTSSPVSMHEATALLFGSCMCKSKSCVVTNYDLSPIFLKTLDDTKYGAQSVVSQAPALGLALLARRSLKNTGEWGDVSEPKTLRSISDKPFLKFESRLRLFRQPQFSIMARSTAFNTYILSVMPYTISYFGLTSYDLNQLRQQAVKFILRRHWLDAETMPYALKWIGVSTVLDPGLAATIASTGLYLREGILSKNSRLNILTLLLAMYDRKPLSVTSSTSLTEGRSAQDLTQAASSKKKVCDLLNMWAPFVPFDHLVRTLAQSQGSIPVKLRRLKNVSSRACSEQHSTVLPTRLKRKGGRAPSAFDGCVGSLSLKKSWCNGICRFAILRWALNQDDDVWLSLRGNRHNQPCQLCRQSTDIYPKGFWQFPICETCIRRQAITPVTLYPDSPVWLISTGLK